MAFKKYTQCYTHMPGDKPFNISDLFAFALSSGAGGLILALIGFAVAGASIVGFIGLGIAYAQILVAVADEWLGHRLACIEPEEGPKCAVGKVMGEPEVGDLGEFDNDEFFDLLLMPHRPNDDYKEATENYKSGQAGKSMDGKTELRPENDMYLDNFQGMALMKPFFDDLPYKLDRTKLHAEAEGNFWVKMREWALLAGVIMTVATAAGAALGSALGCAALAWLGPLGCIIGAILGGLLGAALAAALTHLILSAIAFNSDPGEVEDANVGDKALGPISDGDRVIVYGEHVYDGFHEGWHEFHPLMAVMKLNDRESSQYMEWDPDFDPALHKVPDDAPDMPLAIRNLTPDDMKLGLASPKFRERGVWLRDKWCGMVVEAFSPETRTAQALAQHRWTIHPAVDGCQPEEEEPPIPH